MQKQLMMLNTEIKTKSNLLDKFSKNYKKGAPQPRPPGDAPEKAIKNNSVA